ncbi:uncharacterized protein syt18b [Eucyclogobius newberryi]|uniref:uncharacterized protein syt18b n=1 Tax=Eucyclogobius newberryi TaxID=166745 RepID=UPI003B5B624D
MPYHDEEYPGQPLWQSVLLFCCKGMIEGIMVVLFFWLLIQVLFSKQLEIHLQVLLLVGLLIFCLCLLLGCFICWKKSHIHSSEDKEAGTSQPTPSDPVTFAPNPVPLAPSCEVNSRQHYDELDGDILEYPSTFTSPAPSEREFKNLEFKDHPRKYFSLRRLSTPQLSSPSYKPIDSSHISLPVFPKVLSKTCRAAQRRCTVTGIESNENKRLTSPRSNSPSMPEEPIPLAPLSYGSVSPKPCLHFTMAFSTEQQALAVTILSITGTIHKLEDVSIQGSLPPLYPCSIQASTQSNLCLQPHTVTLLLRVNSVRELQWCVLRIGVYIQDIPTEGSTVLGQLEVECAGRDWKNDQLFYLTKELNQTKGMLKTDLHP